MHLSSLKCFLLSIIFVYVPYVCFHVDVSILSVKDSELFRAEEIKYKRKSHDGQCIGKPRGTKM